MRSQLDNRKESRDNIDIDIGELVDVPLHDIIENLTGKEKIVLFEVPKDVIIYITYIVRCIITFRFRYIII